MSLQGFEQLFEVSPEIVDIKANYYQSVAVAIAMRSMTGQEWDVDALKGASNAFNEMAETTQQSDYIKRGKILEMLMAPKAKIRDLIIEVTSFTL